MKRNTLLFLLSFIICHLSFSPAGAQSWSKKAAASVFTLKTFGADGSLLASTNGFFVGPEGEAVSSFAPFKGAQRAVVIDAQGKELEVVSLMGFNDMYDVAKFRVDSRKTQPLAVAQQSAASGAAVWLLPYTVKKAPVCQQGTVTTAEPLSDGNAYYTLAMTATEQQVGSPVLNDQGEAIGMLQPSADGKAQTSYAMSARFANNLRMSGLSVNDPALRTVRISKELPDDQAEATLTLYVTAQTMQPDEYAQLVERFIQKFPQANDGYVYKARLLAGKDDFAGADEAIRQALKNATPKDEAHYQYAQMIYQQMAYQPDKQYDTWTLDLALDEARQAYAANPQDIYRQLQAQILFAQKKLDQAYDLYIALTKNEMLRAEALYAAAQCKKLQGDYDRALVLLDSAVNTFSKPFVKTAAPYIFARAQALYEAKKYRPAVNDFNEYAQLMSTQLTAQFYFLREQAEYAGHLYQQAIDDIKRAVEMEPNDIVYRAEKANVELRVGMTDEAIDTAKGCIELAPDVSDGYLFLGLAQCVKGLKAEGVKNLQKAKELGNDQAQALIDKYAK